MSYLYIDIETLPAIGMCEATRSKVIRASVPRNYKKPETIAKWIKEQEQADENAWTRTAVHPLTCRLYMVSLALDDGDVVTLFRSYNDCSGDAQRCDACERSLLEELDIGLHQALEGRRPRFVAHNGAGFDFPILRLRALKYGLLRLARLLPCDAWGKDADDTMHMAGGRKHGAGYSLDAVAHFFGVPSKHGMGGAGVYPAWREGRHGDVAEYNVQDVEVLRGAHRWLAGVKHAG